MTVFYLYTIYYYAHPTQRMNQLQEIVENPELMTSIIARIRSAPQLCLPLLEQFKQLDLTNANDYFVLQFMNFGLVILKLHEHLEVNYSNILRHYVDLLTVFAQNYPEIVYRQLIEHGTKINVDIKTVLNIISRLLEQRPQQIKQFLAVTQQV